MLQRASVVGMPLQYSALCCASFFAEYGHGMSRSEQFQVPNQAVLLTEQSMAFFTRSTALAGSFSDAIARRNFVHLSLRVLGGGICFCILM